MNILCKYCNNFKLDTDFSLSQIKIKSPKCKECRKEYSKQYYSENKEEKIEYSKQYRTKNKEKIKENNKQYSIKNKENRNQHQKNRKKNDPAFKLRTNISITIYKALHKNSSLKNGQSTLKHLSYTIEELKNYLELLLEPWMTWENHGQYNAKTWDKNDQSTWVWNLDHITPQTHTLYTSMEDDNFKKCWALENLRPYNAKKNIEEGNNRSQEEIIKIKNDIKERLENINRKK